MQTVQHHGEVSLVDVVERLLHEFEDRLDLQDISRVVLGCRADLSAAPPAGLPELIERLARVRLRLLAASTGTDLPPGPGRVDLDAARGDRVVDLRTAVLP